MDSPLLSRDQFRAAVFARDQSRCVICGEANGLDAHHIIERRLFDDGGYYLDNGATVCSKHHLQAEQTVLTVEEIREAAGITRVVIPPQFEPDECIDKWGNPILPSGLRMRGELFDDESVQKILREGGVLEHFTHFIKYPRTFHLPWSPGVKKDDRVISSLDGFEGQDVVVSVKLDGENSNLYSDHYHARSIDSLHHASRSWVKNLHGRIAYEIPQGWRLCGENVFAKHTIHYLDLETYFYLFSIWNERNECLSWDDTCAYAAILGLTMVPVLYEGKWNEDVVRSLYKPEINGTPMEGYVVRVRRSFHYRDFKRLVAKFVRKDHVQSHGFWSKTVVPNKIREQK